MKGKARYRISLLLVWVLVWQLVFGLAHILPAGAATENDINEALAKVCSYVNTYMPSFAGGDGDWAALGLRKAGKLEVILPNPQTPTNSPTDYARMILGGLARGEDVGSYITALQERQEEGGYFTSKADGSEDTLNHTIWAVIALDTAGENGYTVSYNRTAAVNYICSQQKPEEDPYAGGFDGGGWGVDIDSTAHALIALAPYRNDDQVGTIVNETIDKAIYFLKSKQNNNAGFGFYVWEGEERLSESPDSIAAVIEALIALGIDPQGSEWVKNGKTMVDALLKYQLPNGAFYGPWAPGAANLMTTRNALLALADLKANSSKYNNQLPSMNNFYLYIEATTTLNAGADWNFRLSINNKGSEPKDTLTIAGLYKKEGNTEKMMYYTALQKKVAADGREEISGGMSIPEGTGYEARIMVWDGWTNPNPLISPVVFRLGN
ncbi:hypothetical protein SAMN02745221_01730 [Thermosyntropha lipolytica DSM 11003]|uniref:Prenyltransferase and squalene oxidase repeat-containing protein n=1 Tax=Thermosyntropha lipolytica DSM 11003 TaxID=1123382 RepID=A0A1M5QCJ4_9FIRM|nr:prenyltransferase/squalene oxidase repeat-containing protein [Thermosyntropha lipolytica]SHH11924.1 hypothetical protein SAMN02745221_01730 [Thermosyntropha lipolytica DSM 11003]